MSNLEKAREWANRNDRIQGVFHPDAQAAVDIIQSLPDQWVSVEKVKELAGFFRSEADSFATNPADGAVFKKCADTLEDYLLPKPLTLAEMTPEERKACQWKQARFSGSDYDHVIIQIWQDRAVLLRKDDGRTFGAAFASTTPLPGPKLQWPGSGDTPTISNKEKVAPDQAVTKDVCNSESNSSETPKSSIKPEDVPADELWFVSTPFADGVGYRHHDQSYPWFVIYPSLAERIWHVWDDSQITLIHKLVPETHALPEGMRLADHEKFGRVVTSPWGDGDDDYKIFFLNEDARGGADYEYAHESTLTFLDGEANE